MAATGDLATEVAHLVQRADSARMERQALRMALEVHQRDCAAQWAGLDVRMAAIVWTLKVIALGILGLVVQAAWDVLT